MTDTERRARYLAAQARYNRSDKGRARNKLYETYRRPPRPDRHRKRTPCST